MRMAPRRQDSIVDVPIKTVRHLPSQRYAVERGIAGHEADAAPTPLRDWFFLLGAMTVGFLLRLDFLIASHWAVDADEAIVGLMARHIAAGEPLPTFYYGQHYMGSLEPFLTSLVFRVFGESPVTLRVVPLIFATALIPLIYRLGREVSSRRVGHMAALLCAVAPVGLLVWSTKARGGFIELVYIGAFALLLTVRWIKTARPSTLSTAAIGTVLGFGWWTNNQIVFFMVPIAMIMALRINSSRLPVLERLVSFLHHALSGIVGFLFGGLPFWLYNIKHEFISFQMFTSAGKRDLASQLYGLFDSAIPILVGAKRFWESTDIFPGSTIVAYLLYGAVIAGITLGGLEELLSLVKLKVGRYGPATLLLAFLLTTFATFSLSSFGHLVQAPRYLLPAYVALFVLIGIAVDSVYRLSPTLGRLLLTSFVAMNLLSAYAGGRAVPGEPIVFRYDRVSHDHSELLSWVQENGVKFVKTNYWIGYRLAFETSESLKFVIFREPRQTRLAEYRLQAAKEPTDSLPLVLTSRQGEIVEGGLRALGFTFEKAILSNYTVLHHLERQEKDLTPVERNQFVVSTNQAPESAEQAVDGDLTTRWGSGAPQNIGMQFRFSLNRPTMIRAVRFSVGEFEQDYPRSLIINARRTDGTIVDLMTEGGYGLARYTLDDGPEMIVSFPPVEVTEVALNQMGKAKIFDWSIAEVQLLK